MLMAPGLLAIEIYQAMTALEVFEVPGVLGLPANIQVFSTRVYAITENHRHGAGLRSGQCAGGDLPVIAVVIAFLYFHVVRRAERYAVVTGKAYRPRLVALGAWRIPAVIVVMLFLLFSMVLPFLCCSMCRW